MVLAHNLKLCGVLMCGWCVLGLIHECHTVVQATVILVNRTSNNSGTEKQTTVRCTFFEVYFCVCV